MRRGWTLLGLFLALGCTEDAGGLGDGGLGDGGPPADAAASDGGGPGDAGRRDGGGIDAGDRPDSGPAVCGDAPTFQLTVEGESLVQNGFEGPVARLPGDAPRFSPRAVDGEITLFGVVPAQAVSRMSYYARLEVYRPFWTEARLTLWTLTDGGGPGRLAFVGWSGSQYGEFDGDALSYRYLEAPCVAVDDSCGVATGQTLEIRTRNQQSLVSYGAELPGPLFSAFNGRSIAYGDGPLCPDTPGTWFEGWFAPPDDDAPVPCRQVPRDACITDPRCVLWGSEIADPGYRCVDAANDCEVLTTPGACGGTPTCGWDPGACYCPEGQVCACGGGPAPKCRSNCGGFTGGVCGQARYCDVSGVIAPDACGPIPDGAGVCEWRPDDCAGAPGPPVCACGPTGAMSYDNDCRRRADRASGAVPGRCAP